MNEGLEKLFTADCTGKLSFCSFDQIFHRLKRFLSQYGALVGIEYWRKQNAGDEANRHSHMHNTKTYEHTEGSTFRYTRGKLKSCYIRAFIYNYIRTHTGRLHTKA